MAWRSTNVIAKTILLSRWFPADDPVATAVARFCILREDFWLERSGLDAEEIPDLDGNGVAWRELYFLRQTFGTLQEAKSACMVLQQDKAFQKALSKQEPEFKQAIEAFFQAATAPELKTVRNDIGAHVRNDAVEEVLRRLAGETGIFMIGSTQGNTHYKFANDLAWRMVLLGAASGEEMKHIRRIANDELSTMLDVVDRVLTTYVSSRHLT